MAAPTMLAMGIMAALTLLRCHPDLPVSHWLMRLAVDPVARLLNRTTPGQWAIILGGVAVIGLAVWFEVDEICMLAGMGGSVGEVATLVSTLEWGGLVELAMAGLVSRSMLARLPVLRHFRRRTRRDAVRARRPSASANDDGEAEPARLAA